MNILNTVVLLVAIAWVILQLRATRRKLRSGDDVKIPQFAVTLVFGLCIVAILVFGLSALHLLWLFPPERWDRVIHVVISSRCEFHNGLLGSLG